MALGLLALFLVVVGCKPPTNQPPPSNLGMPPFPPGGQNGPPMPGAPSPVMPLMLRFAKGPAALYPSIGQELGQEAPPWDTIQGQTKELTKIAEEIGKLDPPKGTKESWTEKTGAFAKTITALDAAAKDKDKDKALAANKELSGSCAACHKEHKGGPPRPPFGPPGGPGVPGGPPVPPGAPMPPGGS
jgi:hypothetical protein